MRPSPARISDLSAFGRRWISRTRRLGLGIHYEGGVLDNPAWRSTSCNRFGRRHGVVVTTRQGALRTLSLAPARARPAAMLVTQLILGPTMVLLTFPLPPPPHNAVAALLLSVVALARFRGRRHAACSADKTGLAANRPKRVPYTPATDIPSGPATWRDYYEPGGFLVVALISLGDRRHVLRAGLPARRVRVRLLGIGPAASSAAAINHG
jgi:hypothetical protein